MILSVQRFCNVCVTQNRCTCAHGANTVCLVSVFLFVFVNLKEVKKETKLSILLILWIMYVCVDVSCVCVCVFRGEWVSERGEKMQSSACLSGYTIQHREKLFIQHSLPTPTSKLPSNSEQPEWTGWHGGSTPPFIPTAPHCSQPDCVCSSQLQPPSHSVHPLPSTSILSFIYFLFAWPTRRHTYSHDFPVFTICHWILHVTAPIHAPHFTSLIISSSLHSPRAWSTKRLGDFAPAELMQRARTITSDHKACTKC